MFYIYDIAIVVAYIMRFVCVHVQKRSFPFGKMQNSKSKNLVTPGVQMKMILRCSFKGYELTPSLITITIKSLPSL